MKPYSFSMNGGFWTFTGNDVLTLEDYEKLAGNNSIIKRPLTNYKKGYGNESSVNSGVTATAGFIFYNKNKKEYNNRYELKFGFSFQQKDEESINYHASDRIRFDTLKAFHSNEMYLVDTVKNSEINLSYSKKLYVVGAEFTTHTRQNRIFSIYTGIGTAFGITSENTIRSEYHQEEGFADQNGRNYDYEKGPYANFKQQETTYLSNGQLVYAYIPGGGIIRFSKTRKGFVRRYALNAEGRAGIKWEQLANRSWTSAFVNFNFGFKLFLDREPIIKDHRPPNPFY
jgi:hypothetical protein